MYLEFFFGKSGAYKFKYTLKPLLSQHMEHFISKKEDSSHGFILQVQLSSRVAPPFKKYYENSKCG